MIGLRLSKLSLWLLLPALSVSMYAEDPDIPIMPPIDAFLSIATRSPFSSAAAISGQSEQTFGWFLSGIMYIGEKRYVILQNTETHEQIYLTEGVDTHGFRLIALHPHPNPNMESVSVIVNQQEVRIGYHPDFIHSRISSFRYLPSFDKDTSANPPQETTP
jgi:hypothetical protein